LIDRAGVVNRILKDSTSIFFANYLDATSRLNDLEQFREHAEGFLRREREYFEEEAHPDLEREFLPLFTQTFPPILHSSIILSTTIFLEQELRGFSNALIAVQGLKIRSTTYLARLSSDSGRSLQRSQTWALRAMASTNGMMSLAL
jgi:hypothetical protein